MVSIVIQLLVVLSLCVSYGLCDCNLNGLIYKQLESVVAIENSTVNFTCSGNAANNEASSHVEINGGTVIEFSDMPDTTTDGITVSGECNDGHNCTYTIEVPATVANNNTELQCFFHEHSLACTRKAYLYIASEELGSKEGFATPQIISRNTSSLTIAWTKPWSHPVNNYTVTLNNYSSHDWTDYPLQADQKTWTLINTIPGSNDCSKHYAYVTAYTDIGSVRSSITELVFPMGIEPLHNDALQMDVIRMKSGDIKLRVHLTKSPVHCTSAQSLYYNYTITNMASQDAMVVKGPMTNPDTYIENFVEEGKSYVLNMHYWDDSTGFTHSINNSFSVDYWVEPPTTSSTTVSSIITTTSIATSTVSSSADCSTQPSSVPIEAEKGVANVPLIAVSVVCGVCIAVLLVILSLLMICVVRMKSSLARKKRIEGTLTLAESPLSGEPRPPQLPHRNRSTLILSRPNINPVKVHPNPFPKTMTSNPIYQGAGGGGGVGGEPPVYVEINESINGLHNHRRLPTTNGTATSTQLPFEIPSLDNVAMSEKQSLDSPGVKSGVPLTLEKRMLNEDEPDSNEQYVQMTSPEIKQPRYSKSPSLNKSIAAAVDEEIKTSNGEVIPQQLTEFSIYNEINETSPYVTMNENGISPSLKESLKKKD